MFDKYHIYSLDIETDNSEGHGLDPLKGSITHISVAMDNEVSVFAEDTEAGTLERFETYVNDLEPGIMTTWNGTFFDLPFIRRRSDLTPKPVHGTNIVSAFDNQLAPKYQLLTGESAGLSGFVGEHVHIDIAFAFKAIAAGLDVPWSLKPVASAMGYEPVELDRTKLHEYSQEDILRYVASDAFVTRALALSVLGLTEDNHL